MNLPNALTVSRLVLTTFFLIAVSIGSSFWMHLALWSFIIASITDFLDGYLARKMGLVTAMGKLLDPLADKILVCSGYVYISVISATNTEITHCPLWVTCVIIAREFLVTGLRQVAVEQGQVLAADKLGKWKTTFQLIFQIGVLMQLTYGFPREGQNIWEKTFAWLAHPEHFIVETALWISLFLTVLSGWNYLWSNKNLLCNNS